jgi:putative glutamine amidotransferase
MTLETKRFRAGRDRARLRPLVGITGGSCELLRPGVGTLRSYYIDRYTPQAVFKAGGDPVMVPPIGEGDADAPERYAQLLDAFVIAGGVDIAPAAYGGVNPSEDECDHDPVRDNFEIALVRAARRRRKPILGVCRGMELVNVAFGGSLTEIRHEAKWMAVDGFNRVVGHRVEFTPGSVVAAVYGSNVVDVWCLHHQAPGVVGEPLRITGRSRDGIVEVIEGEAETGFLLGLLFHPEFMLARNPIHLRPYQALIRATREHDLRLGEVREIGLGAGPSE